LGLDSDMTVYHFFFRRSLGQTDLLKIFDSHKENMATLITKNAERTAIITAIKRSTSLLVEKKSYFLLKQKREHYGCGYKAYQRFELF
jgi:hypothetical protein